MKNPSLLPSRLHRAVALLAIPVLTTPMAFAGAFLHYGAGTYEYTDTANWGSGVIGNNWNANITGDQIITFNSDYTTVAPSGGSASLIVQNVGSGSAFNHTFIGSGGDRTLTLAGSLALTGNSNVANTTTIGSTTAGQRLNLYIASGSRKFEAYTNRTLDVLNVISGAGGISREGAGTIRLSNTANTFTGSVSFLNAAGVLEVTKLADGGQDSSIGKSDNGANRLTFGGSSAGTLRYIGAGDSTDRRFTINGNGAIFDASGSGSIKWTNTAAATLGSLNVARTVTFKGTNALDNTMSTAFADSGTGKTSILKQGSGRWIFAGNNTYTGTTTIDEGTLELGASHRIGDSSNLVLNGGTFATGGFSETVGTLTLSGDSTLDLGNGASVLVFADSSATIWGASVSLSIVNFDQGTDSIYFGVDGLTETQLGQITINGLAAALENGYLTAIPEPSTYALLAGVGGLAIVGVRRYRNRRA
jgi:fibronectin-binding autotransporter adhesin